jgi:hypothetical protein
MQPGWSVMSCRWSWLWGSVACQGADGRLSNVGGVLLLGDCAGSKPWHSQVPATASLG